MITRKMRLAFVVVALAATSAGYCRSLQDNWDDFVHFTAIGNFDLAKGYAQAILEADPDPVKLFEISRENPRGYDILLRVSETREDLADVTEKIIELIETGRFQHRTDPSVITQEIRRLSTTPRGRITALKRLQDAGEYAIPYMLRAIDDPARQDELPNIIAALPEIGRDAIRPLVAALQTDDVALKAEIIRALGKMSYAQSLAYLKYVEQNTDSPQIKELAVNSISNIDPDALQVPAAEMFLDLAESYYYHSDALAPGDEAVDFANIWFYAGDERLLSTEEVSKEYFCELMAMRCCEWALRADPDTGPAISLWLAAFFKAESTGLPQPEYFGEQHADALTYATTAGPEYLHRALARAVRDNNSYIALGLVEALATAAGEKSLMYRLGTEQPLIEALSFDDRAVRYSAAIAIAAAGPSSSFPENEVVVKLLADALEPGAKEDWGRQMIDFYATRAAGAMLQLAETRNPVLDLSLAQTALIKTIKDPARPELQKLAAQILAHLKSPQAQRAIADVALNESYEFDVRLSVFESLANSAKINACLLEDAQIQAVYAIVGSTEADSRLRSAAAAAYGALNLPSRKVKDLILDQSTT